MYRRIEIMKRTVCVIGGVLTLFLLSMPAAVMALEYDLDHFYRLALQNAEKIKISEENIRIAEAGKSKALAALLPRLTTFAGVTAFTESKYSETKSIPAGGLGSISFPGSLIQPNTASTWGVRLDENLSLGGRELQSLQVARENLEKNRLDAYSMKEDYLLSVAFAYYGVLRAAKSLDIAEANVERLSAYRMAADKRLRVGEVTRTVLLRAEAELSGALSERTTAGNALELAMAQLKRIVGISGDVQLKKAPPAGREDISSADAYRAMAQKERSDLKALEILKRQAEAQVRFARAAHWPSLTLSGVYSGTDQSPAASTINRESIYAGAALNLPLFEGGLRQAEVREALSKERQSGLLYEDLVKSIDMEVRSAYLDLMAQAATLKYLEDQLVFAMENFRAVARQFEFGLANSIDVMDANTLLVSAERKVADAGYHYRVAVTKMKRATGVLLKEILSKN